jgi:ubiquinone/menaquinone biosynthesis C-methylase UbiE
MERTFKLLEHEGWNERARFYDEYTSRMTSHAIAPLLDAANVRSGARVLDVCCGPGTASAEAVRRGAHVIGVDLSEEMIEVARSKRLGADFRTGDAEALPFTDQSFDCVICNFGILHLPEPERGIAEAARVLVRGGRYAFATWRGPDVSPFFRTIVGAVTTHGSMDMGLPPAPPPFRFADPGESGRVMEGVGFSGVSFVEVPIVMECPADAAVDWIRRATVRMTMLIEAQAPAARARIEEMIREKFQEFAKGGMVRVPIPAIVVSGTKA